MKKYRTLGVIPAQGRSKPIPRKNIRTILGKPLIAYTIVPANQSKLLSKVIVSSDNKQIIEISKIYGADVPFVRPEELATNLSLETDVIRHAVLQVEKQEDKKYDYVVMLQPTTPLRTAKDIDNALTKLIETGADSVISVMKVGPWHPARMKKIISDRLVDYSEEEVENMPQELLSPVYIRNEAIYATKRDVLVTMRSFKGKVCRPYVMPADRSININSRMDLLLADAVMKKIDWRHIKTPVPRRKAIFRRLIRRT